jgi:glucokinase
MYILFDIGGTKMRIAGTRDLKTFSEEPIVLDTPALFNEGSVLLKKRIAAITLGEPVEAIAGGVAGAFDQLTQMIVGAPNLTNWVGKPLVQELSSEYPVPIYIQNDTAFVGLGEMHIGAGEKTGIGAYITVSTGIGGTRFIDGAIDRSTIGFEPGQQIIDIDTTLYPGENKKTLESLISGASTEERTGKKPYDILEQEFWDEYARILAYGLYNTIVHWSPKVVVLGGSMVVGDPAISVTKVAEELAQILKIFPEPPEIRKASLGELGGLYGAMVYIKQQASHTST